MARYFYIVTFITLLFSSCEDVIEVDVPIDEPRLVLDALIRVDTTQEFVDVKIKVTKTNAFFDNVEVVSDLQNIYIYYGVENEYGELIGGFYSNLAELESGSGIYEPDPTFTSDQRIRTDYIENETAFWLILDYEDRRYAAKTYYATSVEIETLEEGDGTLFGDDETELIISFTDTPEKENYYVFDFDFGNFLTSEDTFYEGQPFSFSYFYDESFEQGAEITVSILGANEDFYNYMTLLIEQSEGGFGPFQTPVATVRGNIFDVTGIDNINQFDNVGQPDNFPLGYFAVVQSFTQTLIIE
ncbi:DUF4249 domain-containing protein [Aureisphaera sp. CAU 1614]|uniref:DUF4249 domain-containing protein n=1 Tax=Halomarinibacterium sedimenti TaxID=2857106 RepID=A0A9X1K0G5_9FLAO|nr:DUF4249 domain-containing protein [Halomarinibacterium sedimenti]MBW2938431.1 DUF4249 domain-containing protein [Halomarinibacterium sedimenti]